MKARDKNDMLLLVPALPFIFLKRGVYSGTLQKGCSLFIVGSKSRV